MDASVIRPAIASADKTAGPAAPVDRDARDAALRASAKAFETVFLKEMLSHAGLGAARESFGGGVGEEGFASLLTQEHAKALSDAGGLGLAEHIFEALKARSEGNGGGGDV